MRNVLLERLKELLSYDPSTGLFIRIKCRARKHKIGDVAGSIINGYVRIIIDKKSYAGHKLAYFYMTGDWPKYNHDIHHKNSIRDDNRWSNLECLSKSEHNKTKKYQSKSGHKGIWWHESKKRWKLYTDRKYIKSFITLEEAVKWKLESR